MGYNGSDNSTDAKSLAHSTLDGVLVGLSLIR